MQGYSQKRARAQACKNCRVRKRRCVPAISGNACRLCQTLSVPCSLDTEYDPVFPRRGMHQDQSTASTTPISIVKQIRSDERQDPVELFRRSRDLQAELVSLYFRFIHNVAHTLFHEIRFMRSVHAEKEPTLLVYFMSALSARYSTNRVFEGQAPSLRGKSFFEEAKRLIYEKLTSPSLETVQAFILAGTFAGGEGDLPAKHVYMELARSHSEASSLWESRTVLSAVIQEERRRTWLTVLIVGEWTAADISIGHRHPQIGVGDLPLFDDVVFQRYGPEELTYPDHPASDRCEMWTQMAKMLRFFSSTSDLLRRLSCAAISFAAYCEEVPMLSKCLDQWNDGLPQNLVYNVDNLGYLASQGLGRTFLAMHIGYYHLRQILFFPFLGSKVYQSLDTSAHLHYAISECKRSAHTVSDIVKLATEKADCELNYFLYGHIVVVSSCVHLHTLLLSDEEQESTIARQCLISNFEFLMTLKLSWPVVEISMSRLRKFQEYCRSSMSDPFVLDNWMARFITEHTSKLDDPKGMRDGDATLTSAEKDVNPATSLSPADSKNHSRPSDVMDLTGFLCQPQPPDPLDKTNRIRDDLQDLLNDSGTSHEMLVDNAFEWLLG